MIGKARKANDRITKEMREEWNRVSFPCAAMWMCRGLVTFNVSAEEVKWEISRRG